MPASAGGNSCGLVPKVLTATTNGLCSDRAGRRIWEVGGKDTSFLGAFLPCFPSRSAPASTDIGVAPASTSTTPCRPDAYDRLREHLASCIPQRTFPAELCLTFREGVDHSLSKRVRRFLRTHGLTPIRVHHTTPLGFVGLSSPSIHLVCSVRS